MYLEKGTLISGDAGHNSPPDIGANGYRQEDNLTKEVWNLVQAKLKDLEYAVVDCTPWGTTFNSVNGSLAYRVKVANNSGSKLHLCIHFNAGGGTGVECWVIQGGKSEQYGDKICEEISNALGIRNRGIKDGSGLYVPKYTSMPCVLIECSFVDSKQDMDKYSGEKIANAIVKAITDNNSSASIPVKAASVPSTPAPNQLNFSYPNNAKIIKDFLYVRDSIGNTVPGRRVDIGDNITVLDVGYTKQLVLVEYPTPSGVRKGYVNNATNCIEYYYQDEYSNGSTKETVYDENGLYLGSLDPFEKATPLYRKGGRLHVVYNTNKGKNTKSGYVIYNGGFNKF
ncbi:N-acetylmuramoyl-L-alanine amidase [Clostridium algidicarnis]|uniref:N-acetylmuramoyl-L-alanine amidase n=1 Tax=Clostridium algidicarnis TaxID=37659 RepID=UPI001C0AC0C3|nr:N-acetylmuramoyl-L-alanine amidase [Clostridium algidicarnis]MBU3208502.1 N-acetylmuramoyl-L-alanine amidase [Clostridium algidicarnis]